MAAQRLSGAVLAIAAVATLVAVLLVLNGQPGSGPAPGTVGAGLAVSSPSHRPTPATPSPTPTPPSPSPVASSARPSPPPVAELAVLVLNNSRISHLAARVAAELAATGWPVAGVGNFDGRLPATTLFYAPGAEASARLLAQRFTQISVLAPRPSWLPGRAALTLVVTRYWL